VLFAVFPHAYSHMPRSCMGTFRAAGLDRPVLARVAPRLPIRTVTLPFRWKHAAGSTSSSRAAFTRPAPTWQGPCSRPWMRATSACTDTATVADDADGNRDERSRPLQEQIVLCVLAVLFVGMAVLFGLLMSYMIHWTSNLPNLV